jgi:F-type H+-transporting ATPase subunit delta
MTEATTNQAHADVGSQRVARVYAEALLEVGWRNHQGQEMLDELSALVHEVFSRDAPLEQFLSSGAIDQERKAAVLRRAFEGRAAPFFVNFLLVLNEHGRLELLRTILEQYRELYDQRQNRIRALATSAAPLSPEQAERVKDRIRQLFQREPILESAVDPGLIGGLVLRVGDYLYDGSVRTRLENLRDQLIESSSHEIQIGRDRFRAD